MSGTKSITFETAVQEWLAMVQPKVKISTYAQYNSRLDKIILPYFGKTKIKDITPDMLDNFVKDLNSRGFNDKYIFTTSLYSSKQLQNTSPNPTTVVTRR